MLLALGFPPSHKLHEKVFPNQSSKPKSTNNIYNTSEGESSLGVEECIKDRALEQL
jgi:hypothetical protein